jgi:hypothetical protein
MTEFLIQNSEHWSLQQLLHDAAMTTTVNAICLDSCVHKTDLSIFGAGVPNAVILFDNQHLSGNRSWRVRLRRGDV